MNGPADGRVTCNFPFAKPKAKTSMLWLKFLARRLVGWRSGECRCGVKTNCCQATLWRTLIRASSSWLSVTVFPRASSDSSLQISCSGLMCRRTIRRSFIDSLCEDVLPEEKFLRLSSFGPSRVKTYSVYAIFAWIAKHRVHDCERFMSESDFSFTATSKLALTSLRD